MIKTKNGQNPRFKRLMHKNELIQSSAIILVWLIYFSVVHLKKENTFYCGSDGANYVPSTISDVEKCLIYMYTRIGRAEPDAMDWS